MLEPNTDKDWETFGRVSPYFGVYSEERFLPDNLDESAIKEFFELGEQQVDEIVKSIRLHLNPEFAPKRCLDFGCGVGRLVLPLARRFDRVVGVDVSRSMIDEAGRNSQQAGIENVEFFESDDLLTRVEGKFDFIVSYIVMQHISPKRGERLLNRLIELMNSGGAAALHFTYSICGWQESVSRWTRIIRWLRESVPGVHNLINIIKGRKHDDPLMRMYKYDLNRLFLILQKNGCTEVHVQITDHGGSFGLMLLFLKE